MGNVGNCTPSGGDNRTRKIAAVEALRKSLDEVVDSGNFTGTVAVEVTSLNGNLARIKVTSVKFE